MVSLNWTGKSASEKQSEKGIRDVVWVSLGRARSAGC